MKKSLFIVFALFYSLQIVAQEKLVQFSGRAVDAETMQPISGVRVTNLNKATMDISDAKGWFTIVVAGNDKIQLSHLGMQHIFYNVPANTDSKIFKQFELTISPTEIEAIEVNLPSLDELEEYLMALKVNEDKDREFALRHPDMFNVLDTIIAHEPKLLAFKNGKVESSPISFFYEKVYKKLKERMRKPKKKAVLPKFKKTKEEHKEISN